MKYVFSICQLLLPILSFMLSWVEMECHYVTHTPVFTTWVGTCIVHTALDPALGCSPLSQTWFTLSRITMGTGLLWLSLLRLTTMIITSAERVSVKPNISKLLSTAKICHRKTGLAHQIFNCPCGRTPENHIPTRSFAEFLCLDLYHI